MLDFSGIFYKNNNAPDVTGSCNIWGTVNTPLRILTQQNVIFATWKDNANIRTPSYEAPPLFDSDSKTAVVASSRIDNRDELCNLLGIKNTVSLSDNSLIINLYQKFATDFAVKILGDFAIALWDAIENKLILVSDIMKCRPIYYFDNDQFFAFATSTELLHKIPEIKREPDLCRIANQIILDNYRTETDHRTYFANIRYLPGASMLTITPTTTPKLKCYWQPDINQHLQFTTENEYVAAFNHLFAEAINARIKNVTSPIGVMLSGGLDSSAIAAVTAKILPKDTTLEAFCNVLPLCYTGKAEDERNYIELFRQDNINLNYIASHANGPFADLPELIKHINAPNYISQQYIHKAITAELKAKGVHVLLDGLFGEMGPSHNHSSYFTQLFLTGRWHHLFKESRNRASLHQQPWLKSSFKQIVAPLIPKWLFSLINTTANARSKNPGLILQHDFVQKHSQFLEQIHKLKFGDKQSIFNSRQNQANFMRYWQNTPPLTCYMEKSGIELLHPYLDRRILEFCLSIPDEMRFKNGYPRYMIRRAMQGIMPKAICTRLTKAPFAPDYTDRYREAIPQIYALIDEISGYSLVQEIIDLPRLKKIVREASKPGSAMGGQNIQAFAIVPNTIGLGVFLSTF